MGRKNRRTQRRPRRRGNHLAPNPGKQRVWQPLELWEGDRRSLTERAGWILDREHEPADPADAADWPAKKSLIAPASALWEFVRNFFRWQENYYERYKDEMVVRLVDRTDPASFLSLFLGDPNPYVRLVAKMELLPASVWRKLLWKLNIDFMSFESFFRRLESEQWRAIEDNCDDWLAGRVPRVYGWLERKLKRITVEKLEAEEVSAWERYHSKQAWSADLFGIGFGPEKYVDEDNDKPVSRRRDFQLYFDFLRHLFSQEAWQMVVNDYDGAYFWFYRKRQSNFLWHRGWRIKLGEKFCPGWWQTVLAHGWFWVLSPLLAARGAQDFLSLGSAAHGWSVWLLFIVFGGLTPFWLGLSGLKLVALGVDKLIGQGFDRLLASEKYQRFAKAAEDLAAKAVKSRLPKLVLAWAAGLWFLFLAYAGLKKLFYWLGHYFAPLDSAVILMAALAYVGWKIYGKLASGCLPRFRSYPWGLKLPLAFFAATVLSRGLADYWWLVKRMISGLSELIISLGSQLWSFLLATAAVFVAAGLAWLAMLMPLSLFLWLGWALLSLPPERQERLNRLITRLGLVSAAICFLALVYMAFTDPVVLLPSVVTLLLVLAVVEIAHKKRPSVVERENRVLACQRQLFKEYDLSLDPATLKHCRLISSEFTEAEQADMINRFVEALHKAGYYGSEAGRLCRLLLPRMSPAFLAHIESQKGEFYFHRFHYKEPELFAEALIKAFAQGISLEAARIEVYAEERAAGEKFEKIKKIMFWLLVLPVLFRGLGWLFDRCLVAPYLFLKRILTESCPYVARTKTLR